MDWLVFNYLSFEPWSSWCLRSLKWVEFQWILSKNKYWNKKVLRKQHEKYSLSNKEPHFVFELGLTDFWAVWPALECLCEANKYIYFIYFQVWWKTIFFQNSAWIVPITQGSFLRTVYFIKICHSFTLLHQVTVICVEFAVFSFI